MANVTVTTAANMIPELWGPLVLNAYVNAQKMRPLVTTIEDGISYGDTYHFPTVTALTADDKTAGTDLTAVANTEGKVDLSVNKHKAKLVRIEDIAKVQSKFDLLNIYASEIGGAIGRAIDSDLAALASSCSTTVDGTTTTAATLHTKIIEAKVTLDDGNAPEMGRVMVVTPQFAGELLQNPYFLSKDYRGDAEAVRSGVIGSIYGFDVVVSNALPTDGSTDTNFVFVREAIGLVVAQDIALESGRRVEGLATDVVGSAIYGCGILRQAGCLALTSATAGYGG